MSSEKREKIHYGVIQGSQGAYTSLDIHGPRNYGDRKYEVMVGGLVLAARADTLSEAEQQLLDAAKFYCMRQLGDATAKLKHYQAELKRLDTEGLVRHD